MKRLVLLLSLAGCKAAPLSSATAGAPGAPAGLSVTAGNAENILAWQAWSTASRYEIQRSASQGGPNAVLAMTPLSTYTDSGLANGIAFFYVVSALNGSLASANSNQGTVTPLASAGAEPPAVPAGLTAAADANSPLVTLSWNAVSGATGYVLFRAGVSVRARAEVGLHSVSFSTLQHGGQNPESLPPAPAARLSPHPSSASRSRS